MATVPGGRAGWVIQILPLGGHGLSINRVVLVLLRKVFGGTGILPVRRTGWKPVLPKAAGRATRPTKSFRTLWVGPRPMHEWSSL